MPNVSDEVEECWFDGWDARYRGVRRKDNPYPAGTERHRFWKLGWDDHSAHLAGGRRVKRIQERQ